MDGLDARFFTTDEGEAAEEERPEEGAEELLEVSGARRNRAEYRHRHDLAYSYMRVPSGHIWIFPEVVVSMDTYTQDPRGKLVGVMGMNIG